MYRFRRKKSGFTLIELIAVIAILGILALIAVPRLGAFRQKAEEAKLDSNKRIARAAAALWLAEHGTPGSDEEWDGSPGQDWSEYLDEWPDGIDEVIIQSDGDIVVNGETGGGGGGGGEEDPPAYEPVSVSVLKPTP